MGEAERRERENKELIVKGKEQRANRKHYTLNLKVEVCDAAKTSFWESVPYSLKKGPFGLVGWRRGWPRVVLGTKLAEHRGEPVGLGIYYFSVLATQPSLDLSTHHRTPHLLKSLLLWGTLRSSVVLPPREFFNKALPCSPHVDINCSVV